MLGERLLKAQSILVYAIAGVCLALFVLYLGFMTNFYALFHNGTMEMFEYYKQLQVFNKEAFNLSLMFLLFVLGLLMFDIHKYRPGLFGLIVVVAMAGYSIINSISILNVLPLYKNAYEQLDFAAIDDYVPSVFTFNASFVLQSLLIVLMVLLLIVATITFVQRLREGNPVVRRLIHEHA